MPRPFKSDLVIDEVISEAKFRAYSVGFDQNQFRLQPLLNLIMKVIPEFALGYYNAQNIPPTEIVSKLREAAKTVYTTDKYKKRGEFGEIVLHLLLRDFFDSVPLISKIYFKDTNNMTVHGFDGVHVTDESGVKTLWLGESKFYTDGNRGIDELLKDVANHFEEDYLRSEFLLISRRIHEETPDLEHWLTLMNDTSKLDDIFQSICIPLVCTYSSDIFESHTTHTQAYLDAFEAECRSMKARFDQKNIHTNLEIILLLLPVPDKNEVSKEFDKRLKSMQGM
jgi:hypothetical protein